MTDTTSLPPPGPMNFEGDLADNWERWKDEFNIYLAATERLEKSEVVKISILLNLIGPEGREEFRRFDFEPPTNKNKLDKVLEKFDDRCATRKNKILNRFRLFKMQPHDGEPIDAFRTRLKAAMQGCEYGNFETQMMRDIIIFSIRDGTLQDRVLQLETTLDAGAELTLDKVISTIRNYEAAKNTGKILRGEETQIKVEIARVQRKQSNRGAYRQNGGEQRTNYMRGNQNGGEQRTNNVRGNQNGGEQRTLEGDERRFDCTKCGFQHGPKQCPAFGVKCHACGQFNHYARQCPTGRQPNKQQQGRRVQEVHYSKSDEDDDTEFILGEVTNESRTDESAWYENIIINKQTIKCKLDTGAECNVIPTELFQDLKGHLKPTRCKVFACGRKNEHPLNVRGKTTLNCKIKNLERQIDFYVADIQPHMILGLKTCVEANLVKRVNSILQRTPKTSWAKKEDLIKKFHKVFEGNGKFKKKIHLVTDPTVQPVIRPPRKVPFKLHDKLLKSLDSMERRGIVQKVNHPTDWVNDLVIVESPGHGELDLRICLDPRELNKALKREHHKMPTVEDVLEKMGGMKYYTVVDMKEGFWSVPLDQASADLCTFHTPFGRYQFLRLPYGLNVAPEIFQRTNEELFSGINRLGIVMDDFIVGGATIAEHDDSLRQLLQRALEENARFKEKKFQFRQETVDYIGLQISQKGIQPKVDKVRAIVQMERPKTQKELKRFLGMVNFFGPFIPKMTEINAPLRALLKQEFKKDFPWNHEQQRAFEKLKVMLTGEPLLKSFEKDKKCTIQADASQNGIGACLLQEGRPVAFASASLTETQKRYAQIEKELLAVVYACERFYIHIYGGTTEIQTDHKPLLTIVQKPFNKLSPRLQRMVLRLQRFDLQFTYVPGPEMYVADTLSRLSEMETDAAEMEKDLDFRVHDLARQLNISEAWGEKIRETNKQDRQVVSLTRMMEHGWPDHRRQVEDNLKNLWGVKDNLTECDGIIFMNERILIPKGLRKEVLALLHEGHWGIEKSLRNARQTMYWPGMKTEVEHTVSTCNHCIEGQNKQRKEPMIPHELPDEPWLKLAADIFDFKGVPYLCNVDYYSRYPEFTKLTDKTASSVIAALKGSFARFGIPEEVVADNMPFNSRRLKSFAEEWKFKIITTSPQYPQSNGLAERNIQTIKHLLKKTMASNGDPDYAILQLRNTPIKGIDRSPAQLLMGRRLRTKLPTINGLGRHKHDPSIKSKLDQQRLKVKTTYDQHAKELTPLQTNDVVRFRLNEEWKQGQVETTHNTPKSYWIRRPNGDRIRRNRRDILKTMEEPPADSRDYEPLEDMHTVDHPNPEEQQLNTTEDIYMTRAGRKVQRPTWLKDYVDCVKLSNG